MRGAALRSFKLAFLAVFLALPALARVAEEAPVKLIVGAFAAPGSPWDKDWQTFRRNLDEKAGDRVALKLLIRGETGGEPVTMTAIRRNRIQFGGFTLGGASAIVPELSVLLSPFFFADTDELDYVMDRHMLDVFQPLFAEKNLVLLRWVEVGWLNMYGKKPILLPDDAKGYRLRAQASEASQIMMESLGGDMIQMKFQDVIPSLQTGLIAGGDTNVVIYGLTGLAEEAPHLTLTRHAYDTGVVVANLEWFQGLSPELRRIVDAAFPASVEARAGVRAVAAAITERAKAAGFNFYEIGAADRALWAATTADNYRRIIADIGGASRMVYDAMVAGRADYRARKKPQGADG